MISKHKKGLIFLYISMCRGASLEVSHTESVRHF